MTQNIVSSAPELDTCHWINSDKALSISGLKGKVIALHAFQMLCPGCVVHGIPQASSIRALYSRDQVEVIGLHTVFEHHDVMTIAALEAFVHEYRLRFPIAVDSPGTASAEPKTMRKYQLRGTPSLVLIDKRGVIRVNQFGRLSDMEVGNLIGQLIQEDCEGIVEHATGSEEAGTQVAQQDSENCSDEGCELP